MAIEAFFVPNVSLMGEGCLASLPERVKMLNGKKPLLVADKGMTDLGYTARVTELLKTADIDCAVYDGCRGLPQGKL